MSEIRQAETRDIPIIIRQMGNLLAYLKKQGVSNFADDQNQYVGGLIEYVALKMNNPNHIIFIKDESILIGMVEMFPGFMKHRLVGFLEYVYPLSFGSTPMAQEFEEWAVDRGATAIVCLAYAQLDKYLAMYQREGFALQQNLLIKEL